MDEERRIPPFAKDALAVLNDAVGDTNDGLPKSVVKALLANDDRCTETDAKHTPNVLYNRGYMYYLDDCVRITPTDR